MQSWHFNYHTDKSVIQNMIDLLDDNSRIYVYLDKESCIPIVKGDTISIGDGAMMIGSKETVSLINTNKITFLQLIRSKNESHVNTICCNEEDE